MDAPGRLLEMHSRCSTLRENIVEHMFIGAALRRLWQHGVTDVEILRAEFDAGGYDLVVSRGSATPRHVQLKASLAGGSTRDVKINLKLAERQSGCVIWIDVTLGLELQAFFWLGNPAGQPLPDISGLKVARHAKGTSEGTKNERPALRVVPRSWFTRLQDLDEVLVRLVGALPDAGKQIG